MLVGNSVSGEIYDMPSDQFRFMHFQAAKLGVRLYNLTPKKLSVLIHELYNKGVKV